MVINKWNGKLLNSELLKEYSRIFDAAEKKKKC